MVTLNPYLSFKDNAKEAMEYYHSVLGGELKLTTFKEGGMSRGPESDNLIMHSTVEADGMTLMGSDTPPGMDYKPAAGISISISGPDADKLRGYWDKLAADGMVAIPLEKAPWGDEFGMVVDKYGFTWMVNITGAKA